jgi:assimilatory nitrate reductase catalytic subunit
MVASSSVPQGTLKAVPPWDAVKALFGALIPAEQAPDLALRPVWLPDPGPLVCACFAVGLAEIQNTVASGAATVENIGKALRAGTNCGSCLPELRKIVARAQATENVHERV